MTISRSMERISDAIWEIPPLTRPKCTFPPGSTGRKSCSEDMDDTVIEQITNVATLRESPDMLSACPMAILAMGFRSGVCQRWLPAMG